LIAERSLSFDESMIVAIDLWLFAAFRLRGPFGQVANSTADDAFNATVFEIAERPWLIL